MSYNCINTIEAFCTHNLCEIGIYYLHNHVTELLSIVYICVYVFM